ncbi:MAG: type IX secretion system protein PorQ [Ignavibacterium sp.]|uniref:Type IX secretion system protein PorQ n=1 Tax=Ignavibacterium album TaxID=591197 RepID=A0A7V3E6I9_9BACT|nr:type IX secretion system protein PorQ [Ignavibacterium sp.]
MKSAFYSSVVLILISLSTTLAQNTYEFLKLDMSPRAAAMGGSFVANNDDPDVIFYNPAGLSMLENNPVSFSFVKHLMDINLASVSFSTEFADIGRFGGAIKYINYGTFDEADEFGNRTGEFSAGELALIIGYANLLDANFYYGANVKFIYSSIADRSSNAVAADVGLHYTIPEQFLNFGFSILNLGTQVSSYYNLKEELPLDITIGASKRLERIPIRLSLDFHRLNQDRENFTQRFKAFTIGAEINLSKVLTLRLGYDNERRSDLKIGTTAGIAGFNIGLGAKISEYTFNYGYSSLGLVGALHRVGVSTSF